jgi:hypothetical protein
MASTDSMEKLQEHVQNMDIVLGVRKIHGKKEALQPVMYSQPPDLSSYLHRSEMAHQRAVH